MSRFARARGVLAEERRWRDERARPWRECEFTVVDFETTGPDPRRGDPLSVGWVPVRSGRLVLAEAGYSPVRLSGDVGEASVPVHGLLPSDLLDAPPLGELADVLRDVLAARVLVAHGAHMEIAMLRRAGVAVRRRQTLDTMRLSRSLDRREERPVSDRLTLSDLARRHGLPVHRPHHAFGDALTTGCVFLALVTRLERQGARRLADLLRLGRA